MGGGYYGEKDFSFAGVGVFFNGFTLHGGVTLGVLHLGEVVTSS